MKVNLRKGAHIQSAILKRLAEVTGTSSELATTKDVALFQEKPDNVVAEARSNFHAKLKIVMRLQDILYDMREKMGEAQAQCGINKLLTRDAKLKAQIALLERFSKSEPAPDAKEIKFEVTTRRETMAKADHLFSHRYGSASFNILKSNDIEELRERLIEMVRMRNSISDDLLAKNINETIEISDDDAEYLQRQNVI